MLASRVAPFTSSHGVIMRKMIRRHAGATPTQIWQTIPGLVVCLHPVVILSLAAHPEKYRFIRLTNLAARRGNNTQIGKILEYSISRKGASSGCAVAKQNYRKTPSGCSAENSYFIRLENLNSSGLIHTSIDAMEMSNAPIGLVIVNNEPRLAVYDDGNWKVLRLHGTIK